ncbi:putative reverse transcriptase domain-containing protein [Tanacetum coccineum]
MDKGFLSPKEKGRRRGVKEKEVGSASGSSLNSGEDTSSNVVKKTDLAGVSLGSDTTGLSIQTCNLTRASDNLETPLESNKGDDVNFNANVERKRVAYPFSSKDGSDAMLENGPWFIHNNPLILKKWDPDVNLLKEDVGNVSVWVKLHGVPMTVFSEDGLSVIATKLGTPLMLEKYTSDMCMHSWGRSSYARAMIKLWANVELKDSIVVAMRKLVCKGFYIHVSNKNGANTSGKMKQNEVSRQEFSNLNPFDMLNSIENDDEFDDDGNPLVPTGNVDNESEVEVVFDETTNLMASTSFKGGSDKVSLTNKLFEASYHPSFLQLLVNRLDHDISFFLFQCTLSSLWQRVLIWSVWVPFPDVGFGSFWLGDVDLLLVTFDSQLKIFDSLLNNHASGEHSQSYGKVGNIIAREIGGAFLDNKEKCLDTVDTKSWEVAFLECVKGFNRLQMLEPVFNAEDILSGLYLVMVSYRSWSEFLLCRY